jgi:uncharacterized protein YjeT (DUF2065 family)
MLTFGPLCIVAVVLAVAGVWKFVSPDAARTALRTLGVRLPRLVVRVLGAAEVVLGVATIAIGGTALPAAVGALYVAFAGIAWRLRDADVGCGCFGAASAAPPGPLHVAVDLAAAAVAIGAAVTRAPAIDEAWGELPAYGIPHVALIAVGTVAVLAVLTVLADVRAAARGAIRAPQPVLFRPARRTR